LAVRLHILQRRQRLRLRGRTRKGDRGLIDEQRSSQDKRPLLDDGWPARQRSRLIRQHIRRSLRPLRSLDLWLTRILFEHQGTTQLFRGPSEQREDKIPSKQRQPPSHI